MSAQVIDVQKANDARDVIHLAVQTLAEGKLIAFPTETVYGIAANARDAGAVDKLLNVKSRSEGHPLTLAIKSADDALDYVPQMNGISSRLARRCWPGPGRRPRRSEAKPSNRSTMNWASSRRRTLSQRRE